jgi:cytochrome-b5 reductase
MYTLSSILSCAYKLLFCWFRTRECELVSRTQLTTDVQNSVYLLKFKLPANAVLGPTLFNVVTIMTRVNGKFVARHFSPLSQDEVEFFELMVKLYPGGRMSNHLATLPIGKSIPITPAYGPFDYDGSNYTHIGIIAGGVGIVAMFELIPKSLKETPNTHITLC